MKKSLLILALTALSVSVFGATIMWKSGAMYLPDSTGAFTEVKIGTAPTAYFWIVNQETYNTFNAKTIEERYEAIKDGAFESPASYIAYSGEKKPALNAITWKSPDIYEKGDYGYVVGLYEVTVGGNDFYMTITGYDQINDVAAAKGLGSTGLQNSSWTAVPVPEPTSLALLAFGLIAVGARRKIA